MSNMDIWDTLAVTDPGATKEFKAGGGAVLRSIKPAFILQQLTKLFGPVGKGWGVEIISQEYITPPVVADVDSSFHVLHGKLWYVIDGQRYDVYEYGVTPMRGKFGPTNDIPKASLTDFLSRAARWLGVGADFILGGDAWDTNIASEKFETEDFTKALARFSSPTWGTRESFEKLLTDTDRTTKRACINMITNIRVIRDWPREEKQ